MPEGAYEAWAHTVTSRMMALHAKDYTAAKYRDGLKPAVWWYLAEAKRLLNERAPRDELHGHVEAHDVVWKRIVWASQCAHEWFTIASTCTMWFRPPGTAFGWNQHEVRFPEDAAR